MDPLLLLVLAVVLMLVSVLWLRMHPFLALLLAALTVAVLTPSRARLDRAVRNDGVAVESVDESAVVLDARLPDGPAVVYRTSATGWYRRVGQTVVQQDRSKPERYLASEGIALQPHDRLMWEQTWAAWRKDVLDRTVGVRLAEGLAGTFQDIGLPIAMAAVIGTCLMESGAAQRIVLSIQQVLGAQRIAPALTISAFILGIPVFFDTVFYLLLPLAKAVYRQTGRDYLLYVLAIVVGATMAHSLVPPTPGPLYVASELKVEVGTLMNAGLLLGMVTASTGYMYARWANRRWHVQPPDAPAGASEGLAGDWSTQRLPRLPFAVLPIGLPVVLLGGHSMLKGAAQEWRQQAGSAELLYTVWQWCGDKHLVLMGAAAVALLLLRYGPQKAGRSTRQLVGRTLADAGVIILLTCAGGAFGAALREAGIAVAIQNRFPATLSGPGLLTLAFGITSLVRLAQGSATVAMITGAGIVGPLLTSTTLPFHPVYVALAIGCGSKPFSWMNDSGFWVVGSMSGMDEVQTLKTVSVVLTLMGVIGFLFTLAAASVFPG